MSHSLIGWLVVSVLLALTARWWLPFLGRKAKWPCNAVGWVNGTPYQCREPLWHHGSHASDWFLHVIVGGGPAQERVRWYDGEYGQSSSLERRAVTLGKPGWLVVLLVGLWTTGCNPDSTERVSRGRSRAEAAPAPEVWLDSARATTCYSYPVNFNAGVLRSISCVVNR